MGCRFSMIARQSNTPGADKSQPGEPDRKINFHLDYDVIMMYNINGVFLHHNFNRR